MQEEGAVKPIMTMLPDPDSEEIGLLVDQWLVSLRKAGMSPQQLERYTMALARSVAKDHDHLIPKSFEVWV